MEQRHTQCISISMYPNDIPFEGGFEITLEMTSSVPPLLEINPTKKKNPNCPAKGTKLSKQSCS